MMYSPGQFQFNQTQEVTIYKVQDLEVALQKAMQNISQLQQNLSFMLKYNTQLKQQHNAQQKKHIKVINQLQHAVLRRDKQVQMVRSKQRQYQQLLMDSKNSLTQCTQNLLQKSQQIQRLQRILSEQKQTISTLQDELLSNKYNQVSYQSNDQSSNWLHVEEMEKEIQEAKYHNQRISKELQNQIKRANHFQKENQQYRNWLAQVMGINKVVSGCEKLIMTEIQKKLNYLHQINIRSTDRNIRNAQNFIN